eukprot:gnl/Chilomastix_caulleri/1370.p1 GENE.gnl/Chilomastix_caulleri/1370~~gnl/Chilomastix_caulleri/1370.p1  ORF type:complete len:310 (+),score=81.67 gnl/Chilomastix_caulleri/1370:76-1005(+)
MISDEVRTVAYRDAIRSNESWLSGKRVLDVGSGTCILSLFAAQCNVLSVDAVEASDIADYAKTIVDVNGYGRVITVRKGLLEEVKDTFKYKVDAIISEWMGYCLLFEGMLETVIEARDSLLAKGGLLFPCGASMYLFGITDDKGREISIDFWNNVYGFDMTSVRELCYRECYVDVVEPDYVCTTRTKIFDLDLYKVTKDQLRYLESPFTLIMKGETSFDAFGLYFDCVFPSTDDKPQIVLSTSYNSAPTHWCQTYFYIKKAIFVSEGAKMTGTVILSKAKTNARALIVTIKWSVSDYADQSWEQSWVVD